ncbi:MAG: 3',5'-cyclic-nucleotide phosphodiesterase [Myxococcota bacterium]
MRLRVLGCHGGESPIHSSTCFLVDGVLAIDAGSLTSRLSLAAQSRLRAILISHCHLDHVKDVAMLADNVVGTIDHTIDIVATPRTLALIRKHIMNDVIWPDFTRIPTRSRPVYRMVPIRPGREARVAGYRVRAVRVSHPVESTAFVLRSASGRGGALAFSSDTGPTDALWRELAATRDLRALLLEVSFPNRLQSLADHVGHLTPRTVAGEIAKLASDVPVFLYHMKPPHEAALRREIARLKRGRVRMLRRGETIII